MGDNSAGSTKLESAGSIFEFDDGKHPHPRLGVVESAEVTLTFRTRDAILRYLLNYVMNSTHYSEQTRNCQTFACDFFALLSGRHGGVEPVTTILRPLYKSHLEWFLCDPPVTAN